MTRRQRGTLEKLFIPSKETKTEVTQAASAVLLNLALRPFCSASPSFFSLKSHPGLFVHLSLSEHLDKSVLL